VSESGVVDEVDPLVDCPVEIGVSLWSLVETRRRTLLYVDGIGQEVLDFDPTELRHSVATLLYHIAVFEVDWLYSDILGWDWDEDRQIPGCPPEIAEYLPYPLLLEDGSYTPVSGEPLEVHLERLDVIRNDFLAVVGGFTVDEFRQARKTGDQLVTAEWVVEHLVQHEAEHRGQIWEARISAESVVNQPRP
jgi:hypothetical protein